MSDSDRASNRGTNARKRDRPRKGKDQAEREELSLTRSLREGNSKRTGSPRAPGEPTGRGVASPEGEVSKPKGQPADRGQSRVGEPGSRPTVRGAQCREPRILKTRSLREVHPERGHQRLQGAKPSHRPRHQPQPAEKRVGYERQPQTPSKGRGGNTEP